MCNNNNYYLEPDDERDEQELAQDEEIMLALAEEKAHLNDDIKKNLSTTLQAS